MLLDIASLKHCIVKKNEHRPPLGPGATGVLSEESGYNLTQFDFFFDFIQIIPNAIYDRL